MAGSPLYISNLLESMIAKLDNVQADNTDVVAAVNAMGVKLDAVSTKLDTVAARLSTVDTSVQAVATKANEVKTVLGYGEGA